MAERGQHTFGEIMSQPEVWGETLRGAGEARADVKGLLQAVDPTDVFFIGCGSTHYLSQAAATLFQAMTGRRARGLPASELWFHPRSIIPEGSRPLLVAVSRSGTTTETREAIEAFREAYGDAIVVITCYPESPMAAQGRCVLGAPAAREESVAQTRSFSSMYLLSQLMAGDAAGDDGFLREVEQLPAAVRRLLDEHATLAESLGRDLSIERIFFLGTGACYGLACEAMLKMKEMSLTYAEAFHFMEFRHGPKSMVDDRTLVIGLVSDRTRAQELAVLREMKELGARVLALTETAIDEDEGLDHVIAFESRSSDLARGPLYLPVLQLMAYHRAMEKGLNPDRPQNLEAVVYL
ncbi:MAG: glucosamine-6-phosphate deaminase [Anaerolineae bacterium]